MDRISQLPDEILLRVLSLLPTANDVVATMVLSKRWQFLWMMVPRLVYDDSYQDMEYVRFSRFVDRSLALHEAPVLETLHFKLGHTCGTGDIRVWIRAADKCSLRELIINSSSSSETPVTLPRRLYGGGCRMLVTLKLSEAILLDDVTFPISFQSLKNLSLISMKYPGDEFVNRFLSGCPVLEDLVVKQCPDDNLAILSVRVPSLKSVVLHQPSALLKNDAHGLVIDAPYLECLDIIDSWRSFYVIENNMPKIVEANVVISHAQTELLLGAITSVKRLYLCLPTSKDAYPVGSVFNSLVHLKLCTCETEWLNLLLCLLRDSPYLQALKLEQCHTLRPTEPRPCWNEPSSEYLLSSLETFEWVKYEGTEEEKEVAAFILRSASCLKKATISSKIVDNDQKNYRCSWSCLCYLGFHQPVSLHSSEVPVNSQVTSSWLVFHQNLREAITTFLKFPCFAFLLCVFRRKKHRNIFLSLLFSLSIRTKVQCFYLDLYRPETDFACLNEVCVFCLIYHSTLHSDDGRTKPKAIKNGRYCIWPNDSL